jgi:hypothetical protein
MQITCEVRDARCKRLDVAARHDILKNEILIIATSNITLFTALFYRKTYNVELDANIPRKLITFLPVENYFNHYSRRLIPFLPKFWKNFVDNDLNFII